MQLSTLQEAISRKTQRFLAPYFLVVSRRGKDNFRVGDPQKPLKVNQGLKKCCHSRCPRLICGSTFFVKGILVLGQKLTSPLHRNILPENIQDGGKDSSEKYSKWLMRLQWSEQWAAVASGGCGRRVASICHSTETDTFHPIVQNPPKLCTSELTREMQFFCNSHSILLLQVVSF